MHRSGTNICTCIILSHMYAVYSTQYWILLPVVVQEHVVINMES